ncbi:MAG TPA: cytochrome c family protein [Acetobacteraceae bacterium]|nr:cytochrome c family protein [Acetobacteraceae bacterium]
MVRSVLMAAVLTVVAAAPALAQDAKAGEKDFLVCRACHQIGPGAHNAVGPVLNGVVGRHSGVYPGYDYSAANKNSGIVWTKAELTKYLANPQKVVPGTKMIFPGIKNPQQVKDVIAYLEQYGADGQPKK